MKVEEKGKVTKKKCVWWREGWGQYVVKASVSIPGVF